MTSSLQPLFQAEAQLFLELIQNFVKGLLEGVLGVFFQGLFVEHELAEASGVLAVKGDEHHGFSDVHDAIQEGRQAGLFLHQVVNEVVNGGEFFGLSLIGSMFPHAIVGSCGCSDFSTGLGPTVGDATGRIAALDSVSLTWGAIGTGGSALDEFGLGQQSLPTVVPATGWVAATDSPLSALSAIVMKVFAFSRLGHKDHLSSDRRAWEPGLLVLG
jgi:hypothetical protein